MFGIKDYASACTFVAGYDAATDYAALEGFREFLIPQLDGGNNLVWWALTRHIVLGGCNEPLDEDADKAATDGLFRLLDEFLALRDQNGGMLRIYDDYLTWLKGQNWYGKLQHFVIPPRHTPDPAEEDVGPDTKG